jgi:hypothetical protein
MPLNPVKGNMYTWVNFTWNPIRGQCSHDCRYCYVKKQGEDDIHPLKLVQYLFKATLHCPRCKQKVSTLSIYPPKVAQLFGFDRLCALCDATLRQKHIEDLELFAPFDFFASRGYVKPNDYDDKKQDEIDAD